MMGTGHHVVLVQMIDVVSRNEPIGRPPSVPLVRRTAAIGAFRPSPSAAPERPLTEPTPATQPWWHEPLLLPPLLSFTARNRTCLKRTSLII